MPVARRTPTRHQPKGLTILYEDRDVIVVEKPCGLLTIGTDRDKSRTVHTILNEYVRKGDPRSRNRVYIVHRLDRETGQRRPWQPGAACPFALIHPSGQRQTADL